MLRHSVAALSAAVVAPTGALALLARPAWRVGLQERLGRTPAGEPGAIWIHAASAGEALAASRLIEELRTAGQSVHASTTTVDGRTMLRRVVPRISCGLAPLDHPWSVDIALARVDPALLVLIETELWPVLISAADRRGTGVVVLSGRLSEGALRRYRRFGTALQPTLRRLRRVGARSEDDAARFVRLGVPPERVVVTGDLKLEPRIRPPRPDDDLARMLEGVPVFVAGSTHPGEETAALAALAFCERAGQQLALVLAPRHTERAVSIEREARRAGRRVRRRSVPGSGVPLASGEVLLLDSMGELAAVYQLASVAFVGGTLAPVGGHNLLEPLEAGCPACFGPCTANVRAAERLLLESGAGLRVATEEELGRALLDLLGLQGIDLRVERGLEALEEHRGSLERSLALVYGELGGAR